MKSEYQTVDDKVLLGEPLDQGLEDGQLVLDAGGHDGGHWVSRVSRVTEAPHLCHVSRRLLTCLLVC